MPVNPSDNNVLEVKLYSYAGDQLGLVVLHYVLIGHDAGATLDSMALQYWTMMETQLRNCMSNQAGFLCVGFRELTLPPSIEEFSGTNLAAGLEAADLMSRQVSGIITKRSLVSGRANRGRAYIPFPAESFNTSAGHPEAAYVTALDALATLVFNPVVLGTPGTDQFQISPCIWHRETRTVTGIASWLSRAKWATQKRRGDYGRPNQQVTQ